MHEILYLRFGSIRDGGRQYLLLFCICFFIAMVFEAAFTWVLWSSGRDLDRLEQGSAHRRR